MGTTLQVRDHVGGTSTFVNVIAVTTVNGTLTIVTAGNGTVVYGAGQWDSYRGTP